MPGAGPATGLDGVETGPAAAELSGPWGMVAGTAACGSVESNGYANGSVIISGQFQNKSPK